MAQSTAVQIASEAVTIKKPDAPESPWTVMVVDTIESLQEHVTAWEDLAAHALEPNVFYEPWMLLPALAAFGAGTAFTFVLIYQAAAAKTPARLAGFFPLVRKSWRKTLPVPVLSLWKHLHCFLCTPLLRAGKAREVLEQFMTWARADDRGAPVVQFNFTAGDGPFDQLLVEQSRRHGNLTFVDQAHTRALIRRGADAESYLQNALSSGHRKELRRQLKRLGEQGRLEATALAGANDLERWIDGFLHLEASGWKGVEHSALQGNQAENEYFRTICRAAAARNQLMMLGLELDGRPIALKCNFLAAGQGSFAFKIGYDETFAKFSPGVQLELDNIAALHRRPELGWMDSCALPDHPMINQLWTERRTIRSVLMSTGRAPGNWLVSTLPMLRWLGRMFRRTPRR